MKTRVISLLLTLALLLSGLPLGAIAEEIETESATQATVVETEPTDNDEVVVVYETTPTEAEEPPTVVEAPATEAASVTEEQPAAEEVPAAEEQPAIEEVPATEEQPAEDTIEEPVAEEVTAPEEIADDDEAEAATGEQGDDAEEPEEPTEEPELEEPDEPTEEVEEPTEETEETEESEETEEAEEAAKEFVSGYVLIKRGTAVYKGCVGEDKGVALGRFNDDASVYAELALRKDDQNESWLKIYFDTDSARQNDESVLSAFIQYKNVTELSAEASETLLSTLKADENTRYYLKHAVTKVSYTATYVEPAESEDTIIEETEVIVTETVEEAEIAEIPAEEATGEEIEPAAVDEEIPDEEPVTDETEPSDEPEIIYVEETIYDEAAGKTATSAILTQPKNQKASIGETVEFTVSVSDGATVAWQVDRGDGKGFVNLSETATWHGVKTMTLSFAANAGRSLFTFRAQVTSSAGTFTSNSVTLTILYKPTFKTQPVNVELPAGATASFTAIAKDADSIRWQVDRGDGKGFVNLNNTVTFKNVTTDTLSFKVSATHYNYTFRAVAKNGDGETASDEVQVLMAKPIFDTQPASIEISAGETASFTAASSNADSIRWQVDRGDGKGFVNLNNTVTWKNTDTDTLSFKVSATHYSYTFRAVAKNEAGESVSEEVKVILPPPTIDNQPVSVKVPTGGTVSFTVKSATADSIRWQVDRNDGKGFVDLNGTSTWHGVNTDTLTFSANAGRAAFTYRAVASNASGKKESNAVNFEIIYKPQFETQPESAVVVSGATVTFTATSANADIIRWQVDRGDGKGFVDLNETSTWHGVKTGSLSFIATAGRAAFRFRALATNAAGEKASGAVGITIISVPEFETQPQSATVGSGATVTFTAKSDAADSIRWQVDRNDGNGFVDLSETATWHGVKTGTLTFIATSGRAAFTYRAVAKNAAGEKASDAVTFVCVPEVTIKTQPKDVAASIGDSVSFTVNVTNADTIRWQVDRNDGKGFVNLNNTVTWKNVTTNTLSFKVSEAHYGYTFRAAVKNELFTKYTDVVKVGRILTAPTQVEVYAISESVLSVYWDEVEGASWYNVYYGITDNISDAVELSNNVNLEENIIRLEAGTKYYIWVKAANNFGVSPASDVVCVVTYPATATIKSLDVSGNSITVRWNEAKGANGYRVMCGTVNNWVSYIEMNTVFGDTDTTFDNLDYNTTYYFWVFSINDVGISINTVSSSATTEAEPAKVLEAPIQNNITVSGQKQLTVNWTATDGAQSYNVYYSLTSDIADAKEIAGITATSYTITGLAEGTVYYTWVKAVYEEGESEYSGRKIATTIPPTTKVYVPVVLANTVMLSWEETQGATSYIVAYGTKNNIDLALEKVFVTETEYTFDKLEYEITYYFWVIAANSSGFNTNVTPVSAKTQEDPTAPFIHASISDDSVVSAGGEIRNVYITTNGNWTAYIEDDWISLNKDNGNSEDKTLTMTMAANDSTAPRRGVVAFFCEDDVSAISVEQQGKQSLEQPTNIVAERISATSFSISWDAVAGVSGYYVYYSVSSDVSKAVRLARTSLTSFTANDMVSEETYYLWVVAYDSSMTSDLDDNVRACVDLTIVDAPEAPSSVTAVALSDSEIRVKWSESAESTGYIVYYGTSSSASKATLYGYYDTDTTTAYITGLMQDTRYYVWVSAYNKNGASSLTTKCRDDVYTDSLAPDNPSNVSASAASSSSIDVTWSKVSDADGYRVYYYTTTSSSKANFFKEYDATTRSATVTGLKANTTYYIWVTSFNTFGEASKTSSARDSAKTAKASAVIERYGSFDHETITVVQGTSVSFTVSGGVNNSTIAVVTVNGARPDGSGLGISAWSGLTDFDGDTTFEMSFTINAKKSGDFYTLGTYSLKLWVRDSETSSLGPTDYVDLMTVVVVKSEVEFEPYGTFSKDSITLTQGSTETFTVSGGVENSSSLVYSVNGARPDGSGLGIPDWSGISVSKSTFSNTFTIDATKNGAFNTPGTYTLKLWARDVSENALEPVDTMTVIVKEGTTSPTFTGNFTSSTKTLYIGESWIVQAKVSVTGGSGYLGKVTINSADLAGSTMSDNFVDHNYSSVQTKNWAAYTIDTNVAPWNTPGTYTLRLWAKDTNGEGGDSPLATMKITIKAPIDITGVKLSSTELNMEVGDTITLTANLLPSNATVNANVYWRISKQGLASISRQSTSVTVEALNAGAAVITCVVVSKTGNSYSTTCNITVKKPELKFKYDITSTYMIGDQKYYLACLDGSYAGIVSNHVFFLNSEKQVVNNLYILEKLWTMYLFETNISKQREELERNISLLETEKQVVDDYFANGLISSSTGKLAAIALKAWMEDYVGAAGDSAKAILGAATIGAEMGMIRGQLQSAINCSYNAIAYIDMVLAHHQNYDQYYYQHVNECLELYNYSCLFKNWVNKLYQETVGKKLSKYKNGWELFFENIVEIAADFTEAVSGGDTAIQLSIMRAAGKWADGDGSAMDFAKIIVESVLENAVIDGDLKQVLSLVPDAMSLAIAIQKIDPDFNASDKTRINSYYAVSKEIVEVQSKLAEN